MVPSQYMYHPKIWYDVTLPTFSDDVYTTRYKNKEYSIQKKEYSNNTIKIDIYFTVYNSMLDLCLNYGVSSLNILISL